MRWSARQWAAFERSVKTTPDSVKRAQMLLRLISTAPAERLSTFGKFAAELDLSAWRRQAIAAIFTRAITLGLNPWSVVKGADRRDAIAALIGQRLSGGRFEVLGHRAWARLDHIQRLALYRLAFDRIRKSHDVAQRSASLESLCAGIVGLPASLAVVMAREVIEHFNRDPAMTAGQLWRLAGITDVTLPQRQELMRVAALAFWLRGDEWSGARCHADAEACKTRATSASVRRFLEATDVPPGSSLDARPRRAAAAIAMLEADDPEAADQVAACLENLEPQHRGRFIAHLIVQGQATHVLMALNRDVRSS